MLATTVTKGIKLDVFVRVDNVQVIKLQDNCKFWKLQDNHNIYYGFVVVPPPPPPGLAA